MQDIRLMLAMHLQVHIIQLVTSRCKLEFATPETTIDLEQRIRSFYKLKSSIMKAQQTRNRNSFYDLEQLYSS